MIVSLAAIAVTFVVLTGLTPIPPTREVVWSAMAINGVLATALVGAILVEVVKLLNARRRGRAAARLHVRIVAWFSFIAAVPAILMAVVAAITLDRGLDRWFEQRTRQIIDNALTVAQAYLQEHARVLRGDLIAMTNDVDRARTVYDFEPTRFDSFFSAQASLRGLLAAFIMKGDGTVVTRVVLDPQANILLPPKETYGKAEDGEPVLIAPGTSNLVGGVMKLSAFDGYYLYVTRAMDPRVVDYLRLAEEGASEYRDLETSRFGVQVAFALVYLGVALILLLSAIWIGFGFSNRLVSPIRRLISAADQVSKGNLYVEVTTEKSEGDLANLGASFNNMTGQLRGQRDALLAANEQIDRRRRFTEAVLSGVTTGVVGIDDEGAITLVNRSARALLTIDETDALDRPIGEVIPELAEFVATALERESERFQETQITLARGGRERTVNVRITTEQSTRREHGYVVTIDDITDLVSAQRNSAWADVARRIAHEIKNPLTPIQLSAERIRRRYGKKVEDDRSVFDQCIDTIIRQVGDIGQMVDEFSSFARMRKPAKGMADLRNTVREAVFMQSVGNPDIDIRTDLPETPVNAYYDSRLIGQALTNVIKNAAEAIAGRCGEDLPKGQIRIRLREEAEGQAIEVIDNGVGLPQENRQRLLEPYMTTREKGTGLGLAIVRKIMEDHGGSIELLDAPDLEVGKTGAMVRLRIATEDVSDIQPIDEKVKVAADGI
ncbi:sensor histidine kinase NtrY-like [Polymorphum gilvum]|uniref:histidine kinase n=1 Tax=Polymorphum gilvum (strain LMG 25793 / CGMCC 1.9160 / SL003B-26A1) TaxID=991905 RepID=F2J0P2_POLGS|nr:PAS domain-containing sensor histidine kinase [Polymorphum gilvum]ADZ70728.1 ATPase, histidine kinase-, DNA gyrase B-, and HSP90-like domain protein [Polymorphum gilvum SL003B-26A1]